MGPTSAGKSYTLQTLLRLFPKEAYYQIDAGSPRVLIYTEDDLRHRVVVFSEADSMPKGEDNPAASALRTLMQECRLNYKVTITDAFTGHYRVQEVSKPGPTVVITTSIKGLGPQMDSRVFTVEISDSDEQIQAALMTQAQLELEGAVDPDPALIAFQALLQVKAPWDAVVPFADKLSKRIGQLLQASRINRDFARLLSLIKAVAIVRSEQRELDRLQRVIATLDDYATVYALVNKIYETSVTKVSDKVRGLVAAVEELKQRRTSPISQSEVARHLGVSRQAVNHVVRVAINQGWLVNAETKKGYPANLDLGEPLPESLGLPKPEELEDEEAEGACSQSINGSDTTSNDVSDSHDCQGLTPPRAGDLISPTVVKAVPDGDFDSTRQVKAVKCAECFHFCDWIDVPECMMTKEPIRNPHKPNFCEYSELRESNRKSHDGEALGF
jgi:biotin operon repressor